MRLFLKEKVTHTHRDFQKQNRSGNTSTVWKPPNTSTFLSFLRWNLAMFFFFNIQERVLQKYTLWCGGIRDLSSVIVLKRIQALPLPRRFPKCSRDWWKETDVIHLSKAARTNGNTVAVKQPALTLYIYLEEKTTWNSITHWRKKNCSGAELGSVSKDSISFFSSNCSLDPWPWV